MPAYRIQFRDVALYDFLINIGLSTNKGKTIHAINIPDMYFSEYLKGLCDGDGSTYAYFDNRWKSSYVFMSQLHLHQEFFSIN